MASMPVAAEPEESLAELVHDLGDIPLERIRLKPAPGTATERAARSCLGSFCRSRSYSLAACEGGGRRDKVMPCPNPSTSA